MKRYQKKKSVFNTLQEGKAEDEGGKTQHEIFLQRNRTDAGIRRDLRYE